MDGEADGHGFVPLVPPPPLGSGADPVGLHRHGLELLAAANRLAVAWMREAAAQHAAITRRALEEMTGAARRLSAAEDAPDQARVVLDSLSRAQAMSLDTAREITGLMQRMQGDALSLLGQALPPADPPEG